MNNYLLAVEMMQKMSDEGADSIIGFNRKNYNAVFEKAYQSYVPAFDAIEALYNTVSEPGDMIANMAAAYADRALEQMKDVPKRKYEQQMMNRNMYLAVIVFPSILHYKGNSSQALCDALQKAWKEAFPKSNVQAADVEFINKGFHHKWCYVTTAVCTTLGKPDNCYELETLRTYRDAYLARQDEGYEMIQRYYDVAPSILKHIDARENSTEIYRDLYKTYIQPCIQMIEKGENEKCETLYLQMVDTLKAQYFYTE